jgi:hypothetical protein
MAFKFFTIKNFSNMKKRIILPKNQRDLATISQRVIEKMENNTVFPNPPAALAELKKVTPEYVDSLVKAKSRDKEMVAIKNNKKAIVLELLDDLATYVLATCNDDQALILSSGFDVTDEIKSSPQPAVEILEVFLGVPGEATIRVRKITGTIAFVHQYATEQPGPNTTWVNEESSIRTHTFRGLTSDKRYWFRVVAIGTKGQKAYSPVVSRSIQ